MILRMIRMRSFAKYVACTHDVVPVPCIYIYIFPMSRQPLGGLGRLIFHGFTITDCRHTTIGRTPLDEWSARRRDLYLPCILDYYYYYYYYHHHHHHHQAHSLHINSCQFSVFRPMAAQCRVTDTSLAADSGPLRCSLYIRGLCLWCC
jgi:hypothetical protein